MPFRKRALLVAVAVVTQQQQQQQLRRSPAVVRCRLRRCPLLGGGRLGRTWQENQRGGSPQQKGNASAS
jgi:hypothetical protein